MYLFRNFEYYTFSFDKAGYMNSRKMVLLQTFQLS